MLKDMCHAKLTLHTRPTAAASSYRSKALLLHRKTCKRILCQTVSMLQMDDQGLVNTDPRFIATSTHINNVPTDVRGLTFSRTPQQVTSVTHC